MRFIGQTSKILLTTNNYKLWHALDDEKLNEKIEEKKTARYEEILEEINGISFNL